MAVVVIVDDVRDNERQTDESNLLSKHTLPQDRSCCCLPTRARRAIGAIVVLSEHLPSLALSPYKSSNR
jgi:hypothetical protein